jgi:hypothetical protein
MTERAAAPWFRWLLLAAFASCLNPKPDDEPLARPGLEVPPEGTQAPSEGAGSNNGPPIASDDQGGVEQTDPDSSPVGTDAGVPPGDAGASSGDAGP